MTQNTCAVRVGRLMEIDVAAGYRSVEDIDAMIAMIGAELARTPATKRIVIAADWRPCQLFTPAVAERAVRMLTGVITRVERSAILHRADQATSVLQVFRLVKESHFGGRRVFTKPEDVEAWLGEILDASERDRLKTFLAKR